MNDETGISDEYLKGTSEGTSAPSQKSLLKQFLKNPVKKEEIREYGTSKPSRKIIRAKLVNGKN